MEAQEDHLIKSKVEGDMQLKQVPDKTQHAKEFIHNGEH